MVAVSFNPSLIRLWADEGGYSNHPLDPGGPTNWGITLNDYRKYIDPNATAEDVRLMDRDESRPIYKSKYWDVLRCDELPAGVDYSVFDYGVNSGVLRAARVLRQLVGVAPGDTVTDEVVAAANAVHGPTLIKAINAERLAFLRRLPTWGVFGIGWVRRLTGVKAGSLALAAGLPMPKAPRRIGRASGQVRKSTRPTTAIAVGAGIGAALAHEAAPPWWANVLVILAFAAIGYAVYRLISARRERQQVTPVPGYEIPPLPPIPPSGPTLDEGPTTRG